MMRRAGTLAFVSQKGDTDAISSFGQDRPFRLGAVPRDHDLRRKGLLGGDRQARAKEAEGLVGAALDSGVNFIDTADVYSEGESERLVGAALASLTRPRDQVIVATKVRGRTGPGPNQVGLSRGHILDAVDASLQRLNLDAHRSLPDSRQRLSTPRSKRRSAPSMTWFAPARFATSVSAICLLGRQCRPLRFRRGRAARDS